MGMEGLTGADGSLAGVVFTTAAPWSMLKAGFAKLFASCSPLMLTVTWETKERTVSHDDIGPVVEMLDPHTKRFRVQTLTLESERFWFQTSMSASKRF